MDKTFPHRPDYAGSSEPRCQFVCSIPSSHRGSRSATLTSAGARSHRAFRRRAPTHQGRRLHPIHSGTCRSEKVSQFCLFHRHGVCPPPPPCGSPIRHHSDRKPKTDRFSVRLPFQVCYAPARLNAPPCLATPSKENPSQHRKSRPVHSARWSSGRPFANSYPT